MSLKRYSITGWWNQPGFEALTIVHERVAITTIENGHAFSGILTVDEHGGIVDDASMIFDKRGLAAVVNGSLNHENGTTRFFKFYEHRSDGILYEAKLNGKLGCWCGTFGGQKVGNGTTQFVLQELPDSLFVDHSKES